MTGTIKGAKKATRKRIEKTKGHSKKPQALKREVYEHYSKGKPKCNCCGEDTSLDFLCMDHIKGRKDKKGNVDKRGGASLYAYLKNNDFPKGYQVLCWNCNSTKGVYTKCPHKTKGKPTTYSGKFGRYTSKKRISVRGERR